MPRPRRSLLLDAYGVALAVAGPPVAAGLLAWRTAKRREMPRRRGERRGQASWPRPAGELVWVHGASVGELVSLLPVTEALVERGFATLVTSGTVASAEIAAVRLPAAAIHQFAPLDVPRYLRRFLDHWRPALAVFAESELWPATIAATARRGIPLILANARMSDRSFRRWRRAMPMARAVLGRIELCLAQSAEDGQRLAALGAPRVETVGNLKLDVPPPPAPAEAVVRLSRAFLHRRVLVAASTHPGEEAMLAEAHAAARAALPGLLTVIVPRHPERGAEVAAIAARAGLAAERRTETAIPAADTEIYVADTIGELGLFYRTADLAFLGGSLVPHGGQNPIEPAKLGAAILHGPHVGNFAAIYAALDEAGAAHPVASVDDLAAAIVRLGRDAAARHAMRDAAFGAVERLGGALGRTIAALDPYLMQMQLRQGG
ncbi:MAG TPA: 3-deoxy-D-manno-octulosonic acid transferase [Hyphomicrobiales bacterium]|nr:3-deoxy-D-manno-octulosonic acid transferase [Hyphomicrobiales bacterium]